MHAPGGPGCTPASPDIPMPSPPTKSPDPSFSCLGPPPKNSGASGSHCPFAEGNQHPSQSQPPLPHSLPIHPSFHIPPTPCANLLVPAGIPSLLTHKPSHLQERAGQTEWLVAFGLSIPAVHCPLRIGPYTSILQMCCVATRSFRKVERCFFRVTGDQMGDA